jgi:hypothetical protein
MNRIKRASQCSFDDFKIDQSAMVDKALMTLRRIEHLITSLQAIIQFLSSASMLYESNCYRDVLKNLFDLHKALNRRYPQQPLKNAGILDDMVARMVQYVEIVPLAFFKSKSGSRLHDIQELAARKQVLAYAHVMQARTESMLEIAHLG